MKEMDQFLEVLLEGFQLTRCDGARGVELSVAFDDDTPVIRNRQDRESVRDGMGAYYDAVVEEYQRRLHALLLDGTAGSFSPYDPKFRWRWASAGTLPILSRDGQSSCDSRSELLDPSQAVERELAEELVIVSRSGRTRYALPFKWEAGPDTVILKTPFHDVRRLENYIVNINATDFGIELDRIARIAVPADAVLCDGEITNGRALEPARRVVSGRPPAARGGERSRTVFSRSVLLRR